MRKRVSRKIVTVLICLGLAFGIFDGIPVIRENLSGVAVAEAAIAELYWPVRNANGACITGLSSNHGGGHKGIDIKNSSGCNWYAAYDGVVYKKYTGCVTNAYGNHAGCNPNHGRWDKYCNDGFGNGIVIRCNIGGVNYYMQYAHMASVSTSITEGQTIAKGTYLGVVGDRGNSRGPHAHFEIDKDKLFGTAVNNDPTQGGCQFSYNYSGLDKVPHGCVDYIGCTEPGKVKVRGWAFDWDNVGVSLAIHVYIGGPAGSGAPGYAITANVYRPDVNRAYPGVGNYHGFEEVIETKKAGNQNVFIYAINIRSNGSKPGYSNLEFKGKSIYITTDTVKPTVSNIKISGVTRGYYTVTATATDNIGVKEVNFATWTSKKGQDDLKWTKGVNLGNNRWQYRILASDHNMEGGEYITHVYASDAAGNNQGKAAPAVRLPDVADNKKDTSRRKFETQILNMATGYYLYPSEKTITDDKQCELVNQEWNGKNAEGIQRGTWIFSRQSDGCYTIQNKYSGKMIEISQGNKNPGTSVILSDQKEEGKNDSQKFYMYKSTTGYFITSKCTPYTVLDIKNHKSGTSIYTDYYDPLNADQIFLFNLSDEKGNKNVAVGSSARSAKGKKSSPKTKKTVAPGKVTKLKAGNKKKKSVILSWKKVSGAKGYQIQYATNKKFKKKKSRYIKSLRCTVKNLKKRKIYYFRIRAYRLNGKEKIYGKWSQCRKVRIKK